MEEKINEAAFSTEIFKGALNQNEEMNKTGKIVLPDSTTDADGKDTVFCTDSFNAALKIHDDRENGLKSESASSAERQTSIEKP